MVSRYGFLAAALALAAPACSTQGSVTDLLPGPPFIMQVRMDEAFTNAAGNPGTRRVFAYGFHKDNVPCVQGPYPTCAPDDEHPVTSAIAGNTFVENPGMRIIVSKLLLGNSLEEIACRAPINNETGMSNGMVIGWDHVPVGDTPDDIAACSAQDLGVLAETCRGPTAVCVCQLPGGCGAVAQGQPVGVLNLKMDGAADAQRLIPGIVGIVCDGMTIPINLNDFGLMNGLGNPPGSYYDPSGFQEPPAGYSDGFEAMGPAIVLVPGKSVAGIINGDPLPILPTSATCHLTISQDVTDKANTALCAPTFPAGADATTCPSDLECVNLNNPCAPGDFGAFTFGTEPLQIFPSSFIEGETGAPRSDLVFSTADKVIIDPSSAGNVTMTENTAPFTAFTVTIDPQTGFMITVHPTAGMFDANASFAITFQTNFTDAYGKGAPAPIIYHFMTGM